MGFIPNEAIQQVLDRSDIVEVISSYIPLKRAGSNFKALCPFHHEKTPSFIVNPKKQIYHCFGCGAGGNVISFVMGQDHLAFPEAVRHLAQKAGVVIASDRAPEPQAARMRQQMYRVLELAKDYYHRHLVASKDAAARSARKYLTQRGLNVDTVKAFQLGFAPDRWDGLMEFLKAKEIPLGLMEKAGLIVERNTKEGFYDRFRHRIIFPVLDIKGRCVAFGGRALDKKNPAKYINSPETPIYTKGRHLYGLNWARDAIAAQDRVVIVEGYMDLVVPFQHGIQNIVASLGTALTLEQIRLIRRFTNNVVMLFDADAAGESAMIRSLDSLIEEGLNVRVGMLGEGDDPDSFVRKHGPEVLKERIDRAVGLVDFKLASCLKRFTAETIEGRAAIANALLPTVAKFPDEIIKSEYIKKISGILSVSREALTAQMQRVVTDNAPEWAGAAARRPEALPAVEKNILRLMLDEREFIPLTKNDLEVEDFENKTVRTIVAKVFELFGRGKDISSSHLTSHFDDQGIVRVLSELMAAEDILAGDKKKIYADCIHRLKQTRLKGRRRQVLKEIQAAEAAKDQAKIEALMKQFNLLIKG